MVYWLRWRIVYILWRLYAMTFPDKEYLYITTKYGTEGCKFYLKLKEGQEIDDSECADDQETRAGDAA